MREIVLDTETTGLDPATGDRIVEIGCVELINHVASGATYHTYVNPERDMPQGAFEVHRLSEEFLSGHPVFAAVVEDFVQFIGAAPLVIHNAEFDMKFINAELQRVGRAPLPLSRTIDTLLLARRKFPGAPASLDALCRRFDIDLAVRAQHGALVDAQLLARVYLELSGGRQPGLSLAVAAQGDGTVATKRVSRPARPHDASAEELAAHQEFVATLTDPVWKH